MKSTLNSRKSILKNPPNIVHAKYNTLTSIVVSELFKK